MVIYHKKIMLMRLRVASVDQRGNMCSRELWLDLYGYAIKANKTKNVELDWKTHQKLQKHPIAVYEDALILDPSLQQNQFRCDPHSVCIPPPNPLFH